MAESNRAGWILVGGRSTRMGTDKAFLDLNGRALALRVADQIGRFCGKVTLVGDPARHATLGLPIVADEFMGAGPLAGIEAALRCTDSDWNLVVACDMPALESAPIESLFAAGGDCALPEYEDGKVEPLCAVYHRRCHPAIRSALQAGTRKVTDALRRAYDGRACDIRYVPVPSQAPFANLNTPEDLQKYTNG